VPSLGLPTPRAGGAGPPRRNRLGLGSRTAARLLSSTATGISSRSKLITRLGSGTTRSSCESVSDDSVRLHPGMAALPR
jgi:hypothetical protein